MNIYNNNYIFYMLIKIYYIKFVSIGQNINFDIIHNIKKRDILN